MRLYDAAMAFERSIGRSPCCSHYDQHPYTTGLSSLDPWIQRRVHARRHNPLAVSTFHAHLCWWGGGGALVALVVENVDIYHDARGELWVLVYPADRC